MRPDDIKNISSQGTYGPPYVPPPGDIAQAAP